MPRIKAEEKERKAREKESKRLGGKPGTPAAAAGKDAAPAVDAKKVSGSLLARPSACRAPGLTDAVAATCASAPGSGGGRRSQAGR